MAAPDWIPYAGLSLGAWGALLSSWSAISAALRRRRTLRVTVRDAWVTLPRETHATRVLDVTFMNAGDRVVALTTPALEIMNGRRVDRQLVVPDPMGTHPFPVEIEDGRAVNVWYPLDGFIATLHGQGFRGRVRFRAAARSQVGEVFRSRIEAVEIPNDLPTEPRELGRRAPNPSVRTVG